MARADSASVLQLGKHMQDDIMAGVSKLHNCKPAIGFDTGSLALHQLTLAGQTSQQATA